MIETGDKKEKFIVTSITTDIPPTPPSELSVANEGGLDSTADSTITPAVMFEGSRGGKDFHLRLSSIGHEEELKGQSTAFAIFFILGLGNLLPWNAFITASSYYQNRFCGTMYENSFESYFSMFYTVSQPLGLLATIIFKKRITTKALVLYPLIVYTSVFILTTILALIPSVPQALLFAITLLSTFACGLCGAIMNGGLFGLSGILPAVYTGALMSGQGLAGSSVSAVSLLIVAVSKSSRCSSADDTNNDHDDTVCNSNSIDFGAFAYFLVASMVLGVCIVLFRRLLHIEYVRHFMKLHLRDHLLTAAYEHNPLLKEGVMSAHGSAIEGNEGALLAYMQEQASQHSHRNENIDSPMHKQDEEKDIEEASEEEEDPGHAPTLEDDDNDHGVMQSNKKNKQHQRKVKSKRDKIKKKSTRNDQQHMNPELSYDIDGNGIYRERKSVSDLLYASSEAPSYQLSTSLHLLATSHPSSHHSSNHHNNLASSKDDHASADLHVTRAEIWLILCKIAVPALSVFLVFAGTLSVFPSILVLIRAQHACDVSRLFDDLWVPFLFLLLNLCDFTGRILAPYLQPYPWVTPKSVWITSLVRLLIPAFLCMSNIAHSQLPIVTRNDGVTMLLTALLGFTNGLLANLSMMFGPSLVEAKEASLAGTIMIFCLSAGLLAGACMSFLLLYVVIGAA